MARASQVMNIKGTMGKADRSQLLPAHHCLPVGRDLPTEYAINICRVVSLGLFVWSSQPHSQPFCLVTLAESGLQVKAMP